MEIRGRLSGEPWPADPVPPSAERSRWYAVQVQSNFEAIVESQLLAKGTESFYPSYERKRIRAFGRERNEIVRRPYFPGYVFSRFAVGEHRPVIEVPQIVRIVGLPNQPMPIPDSEIDSVRKVAEVAHLLSTGPCEYFSEGQEVIVRQGPLAGLRGRVCYLKNSTRIVISVEMLRQSVSAEVDAAWLDVLEAKAA